MIYIHAPDAVKPEDMPSRADDTDTPEYVATVKDKILGVYKLFYKRETAYLYKSSSRFELSGFYRKIFCCADYFWNEVKQDGNFSIRRWKRDEPTYTWKPKAMSDEDSLHIINFDVRDLLAMDVVDHQVKPKAILRKLPKLNGIQELIKMVLWLKVQYRL